MVGDVDKKVGCSEASLTDAAQPVFVPEPRYARLSLSSPLAPLLDLLSQRITFSAIDASDSSYTSLLSTSPRRLPPLRSIFVLTSPVISFLFFFPIVLSPLFIFAFRLHLPRAFLHAPNLAFPPLRCRIYRQPRPHRWTTSRTRPSLDRLRTPRGLAVDDYLAHLDVNPRSSNHPTTLG